MAKRRAAPGKSAGSRDFKALLASDLRTGNLLPVYVLEGEDSLRIEQVAAFVRGKVVAPGSEDFNDHVLDAETVGWAGVLQQARAYSMFGGRQAVWARHADLIKPREKDPHEAALAAYLREPADTTVLIISGRSFDARRAWLKTAKERGYHVQFAPPRGAELIAWIRKAAERSGLSLDDGGLHLLAELVGSDLQALQGELDKLALLQRARGAALTGEELPGLILEQVELDAFSLTDAAGPGQGAAMLRNWYGQTAQGKSIEELAPALLTHLRRVALAAACREEGLPEDELAARSKLNAWLLRTKLGPLARHLDPAGRRRVLQACLECDVALKSRPLPPAVAVVRLLAAIGIMPGRISTTARREGAP